ncbi:MAG: exodeoxyribonuclease VII large subunit [Eubacteriales bacterium]|nr:exodeoxyribonuclease VII large subunit [Eubacteriales bacterium]
MLTLTVEELNEYVRRTLAGDPMLHGLRLRGEISNFKRHVSGHWYFTLKDSQSAISCVMFRSAAMGVRFAPRDGAQVILSGSVGLYAKTGSYQFYAEGMEPDGLGELYLRMEALKKKLEKEGLFDPALKKPLPLLPGGIGIATSSTGAVLHDIARVTWRRDPGMPLYLYPVAVQGEGAAEQIAFALAALDRLDAVDVIIVGRGGGSMEDLRPFNEEIVARAIAACHKPVVSAVGHETDFTIADFVADVRAPTPSAAAEIAVPQREALLMEIGKLSRRMRRAGEAEIAEKAARLSAVRQTLTEQSPENLFRVVGERLKSFGARFALLYETRLNDTAHRLDAASVRLRAAGPQATLNRGYALLQQEGRTVPSVERFQPELPFSVRLRDGQIDAKATRVRREEQP